MREKQILKNVQLPAIFNYRLETESPVPLVPMPFKWPIDGGIRVVFIRQMHRF